MIRLQKLKKMADIAFDNSLRLHTDSITLHKLKSYPSAFFLSALAQEEIGKMHMINNYVWNYHFNGIAPEFQEEWLSLIYKHPHKQHSFLRHSPLTDYSAKGLALMQSVFEGTFEAKKQGSIYVGLKRNKGKIDFKGRIRHPFQISKNASEKQITQINDYLLVTGVGVKFGQFSLDNDKIESKIKNKRLLMSLMSNWTIMSKSAQKIIKSHQKFFKKDVLNIR
jgi:AbiV family abortive infection protein